MEKRLETTFRFSWMRNASVAVLCFYYYLSLFRQESDVIGFDVKKVVGTTLVVFFGIILVQLLLNFRLMYSIYQRSRLHFILALAISLLFTILTGQSWVLIPFLLFLSYADTDFKPLAKRLFVYSSCMFLGVVLLSFALPDLGRDVVDKSYSVASIFGSNANSLGFPNSNHPMLYFMVIVINGGFLIHTRKKRKSYSLLMFFIATILFLTTLSVTGYISILLFLFLYSHSTENRLKALIRMMPFVIALSILLTPIVALRYGQNDRNLVNESLSNRPYTWRLRVADGAYKNILGNTDNYQSKDEDDKSGYTIDNQYLLLITRFGWVVLGMFIYIYFVKIRRLTDAAIVCGLFALSLYFTFESVMFILVLCIVPVITISTKILIFNHQKRGL